MTDMINGPFYTYRRIHFTSEMLRSVICYCLAGPLVAAQRAPPQIIYR